MSGFLYGVEPADPPTLVAVMAAMGLTALLASLAPLRAAMLVSPADTLRSE
jgi:ABC-type lipoprotein release transport system permease subunit